MKTKLVRYSLFFAAAALVAAIAGLYIPKTYTFAEEKWLWLLLAIPLLALILIVQDRKKNATVKLSALQFLKEKESKSYHVINSILNLFKLSAIALFILALARPQSNKSWQDVSREGIDIVISLDISGSMLAKDFEPNRLEAAKNITANFISNRPMDRIGLVVYEGEAFTQCPLTTDHRVLIDLTQKVKTGLIEGGTAIGLGLATAINRLKESDAKSKVIILLSDGENNAGSIPPITAAEIAREKGIRVYTIAVGTYGKALSPVAVYPNGQYKYDYVDVSIDEPLLTEIAELTGGMYFRATDNKSLEKIYAEIDQLEKTKMNVTEHVRYKDEFLPFVLLALGLILAEFVSRNTILKTVN
ncbi:MAG: VWA domain-containing protein [Luteibaculaceae bacterium]